MGLLQRLNYTKRQFPASGKLRSAGRTNFSPTTNVSLQPTVPCTKNCLVLGPAEFWRTPFCAGYSDYSASSVRRQRRESTEHELGSYLPTNCRAQLRLHRLPTASRMTHPLLGMRTLGKYFGQVLNIFSDCQAYKIDTVKYFKVSGSFFKSIEEDA